VRQHGTIERDPGGYFRRQITNHHHGERGPRDQKQHQHAQAGSQDLQLVFEPVRHVVNWFCWQMWFQYDNL